MTRARDLAAFVSNADGDIKFDTDTLFIDSSANRVGIQTATPSADLHISKSSGNAEIKMTTTQAGQNNTILFGDNDDDDIGKIDYDHNTEVMHFRTNTVERLRFGSSETVFNEASHDNNFRVESDNTTHGIFLDAGTDRVGLLGNRTGDVTQLSIGDTSGNGQATENGTTDAIIYSDSAISSNTILALDGSANGFSGSNEAGIDHHLDFRACAFLPTPTGNAIEQHVGARISMSKDKSWNESSAGAGIYSSLIFYSQGGTYTTPSLKENLRLTRSSAIFNDDSGDIDFRVESNNQSAMLFVDGGNDQVVISSTVGTGVTGLSNGKLVINQGNTTLNGMVIYNQKENYSAYTAKAADNTGNRFFGYWVNSSGTNVGSISFTSSSSAFNTTSDYRLKENVIDLSGATERLKQLQPKRFNFIIDPDKTVDGFLAHEAATVVPEAVTGEKDAINDDGSILPQGIDNSKLVPLLVATIKELEARITALENA